MHGAKLHGSLFFVLTVLSLRLGYFRFPSHNKRAGWL